MKKLLAAIVLLTISISCFADVKLPAVIGDNMVVQQKSHAAIWGWADPGEKVNVKGSWEWLWGRDVIADANGKWMVKIPTPPAGGPFSITIKGKNEIKLKNVLSGEVWLCSGQSNMNMPVKGWHNQPILNSKEEIKNANYPKIRLFQVPLNKTSKEPQYDCDAQWQECSSETVTKFSAIAYFFGRDLQNTLNVPIGLIHTSYGGSPAEAWMPRNILESNPDFKPVLEKWDAEEANIPLLKEKYDRDVAEWKKASAKAKEQGTDAPAKPRIPWQLYYHHIPTRLYNCMRLPVQPYTIKGMIWYQGESNTDRAYQYRTLFPAMIENWREEWGQGDFPFYYVQIASYQTHRPTEDIKLEKGEPGENSWAELREAQTMSMSVPNTGMAVAIDVGEINCIHPRNKQDVSKRLAAWALAKDYGKKIPFSGPIYKDSLVEGDKIRIFFDYADNGLMAKGETIEGFAIAGVDKKYVWADAVIDGDTVVVSSPAVKEPVAVRYAWAKYPFCNLFNKDGFPASPFRTDEWKGVTEGRLR